MIDNTYVYVTDKFNNNKRLWVKNSYVDLWPYNYVPILTAAGEVIKITVPGRRSPFIW